MTFDRKKLLLFIILLLVIAGSIFTGKFLAKSAVFFYEPVTQLFEGMRLFKDIALEDEALRTLIFSFLLPQFLRSYVIAVYLIFIPTLVLSIAAIYYSGAFSEISGTFNISPQKSKILLISFCLLIFVITLLISYIPLKSYVIPFDEASYYFQTKILSRGKLYVQSPPIREAFTAPHIINNGKWYSKYTPGWPALLLPGYLTGHPFVISALLNIGSLLVIFSLSRFLFDEKTGWYSILILCLSPFFILNGSTLQAHTATGFFSILILYGFFRGLKENSTKYYAIMAASLVLLVQIRPVDAALVMLPILIYFAINMITSKDRKTHYKCLLFLGIGFAVSGGSTAIVNYIQNGSPTKLSFMVFNPDEKWGFGTFGHSIYRGIWNVLFSTIRMSLWTMPLFIELALIALFGKSEKVSIIYWIFALYIVFFIGFFGIGGREFGARFFFVPYLMLSIPAARGLVLIDEFLRKKAKFEGFSAKIFIPACIICIVPFVYPMILNMANKDVERICKINNIIPEKIPESQKALLFMTPNIYLDANNDPWLKNRVLRVLFLEPEKNLSLMEKFPERVPYLYRYDSATKDFIIERYPAELCKKSEEIDRRLLSWAYYNAGLQYFTGVKNPEQAAVFFRKAIEADPQNAAAYGNLMFIYFSNEELDKAEELLKILLNNCKDNIAYYYMGRIEGKRGNYSLACSYLRKYIESGVEGSEAQKALGWIKKYSELSKGSGK